ncbi:MAG: hypothetical protein D6731_16585, partial [Planctomycetota bacterium]
MGPAAGEPPTLLADALHYALGSLACGVRHVLADELEETPRAELVEALQRTFRGSQELKGALEESFERSLQSLFVGLKQAWLLMETGGEDYCAAFGERVRMPFVAEEGLEGRLFLDLIDGFFLDYDTALDAAGAVLGLPELDEASFFEQLLEAGAGGQAADMARRASEALRRSFVEAAGLEEEHPILRLGCWRDLLAEGLHYHFTELAKTHPVWSRYLELFEPEALEREGLRAIVKQDARAQARLTLVRTLNERRQDYAANFGRILPNREWLFDLAERLDDAEETVESDLLKGRSISAHDLPTIVAAGVGKVHAALGTSAAGRLADALAQPNPALKDILRRSRRDFRRSHWQGAGYGDAALQLGGALLPISGPKAAERYYREALAFGADLATGEYGLYFTSLCSAEFDEALSHLLAAAEANPQRYQPFDTQAYRPERILGAGAAGPTFLADTGEGKAVVKLLWDPLSLVDPRPSLRAYAARLKAAQGSFPRLLHLGVHHKEWPYLVTEFVEGDDLDEFREARGGELPPDLVREVGSRIAAALEPLHATGLAHGNLSPGNVRVYAGEEGLAVRLLDPGLPGLLLAAPDRVPALRKLLAWSRVGRTIAESFANHRAPEVVRSGAQASGPAADVYSLGALLYRLATGAPPRRPDPAALPTSLREAVMRCLARDPQQRPTTAAEVRQLLVREAGAPGAAAPGASAAPAGADPFAPAPGAPGA